MRAVTTVESRDRAQTDGVAELGPAALTWPIRGAGLWYMGWSGGRWQPVLNFRWSVGEREAGQRL